MAPPARSTRPPVQPLAPDAYKVQFTANARQLKKLEELKALLRHRNPEGELASIMEFAFDAALETVKKQRFGTGRKARSITHQASAPSTSEAAPGAQPADPKEMTRPIPEMTKSQKRAVSHHRRQQKAKGLVRVEVQAPANDAALIRELAATLRSGSRRAAEVRSLLRSSLRPEKTLLDALTLDLPDEVVDAVLARPRGRGRKIEL